MSKLEIRSKVVLCFIFGVFILLLYYFIFESGVVPGSNEKAEKLKNTTIEIKRRESIVEGDFLDRNGDPLTSATEEGMPAELLYPEETSVLIGYNSKIYGTSALRNIYDDYLFEGNKDNKGATIKLTLDLSMQKLCYGLLGNDVGSIVVMDNSSGAILAMASRSSEDTEYDANMIDEKYETYASKKEFFLNRAVLSSDAPGSTFKIVTASALLEAGKGNFVYVDRSGVYRGIHNASGAVYGEIDLTKALVKSANVYFACAAVEQIGGVDLEVMSRKYRLGEQIQLDFAMLSSGINFDNYQTNLLAETGFGQGKTQLSPLNLMMIMNTVINDGKMVKPYLIQSIDNDGKNYLNTTKEVIDKGIISEDTAEELKTMLSKAAESYKFSDSCGTVYAKTGTCQLGKTYNHIYLVFGNNEITGVISLDQSHNASKSLVPLAEKILRYSIDLSDET